METSNPLHPLKVCDFCEIKAPCCAHTMRGALPETMHFCPVCVESFFSGDLDLLPTPGDLKPAPIVVATLAWSLAALNQRRAQLLRTVSVSDPSSATHLAAVDEGSRLMGEANQIRIELRTAVFLRAAVHSKCAYCGGAGLCAAFPNAEGGSVELCLPCYLNDRADEFMASGASPDGPRTS